MECPTETAIDPAFFRGLKGETRFFLARHGESEGNARRVIQGHTDYPLNDAGRAQAGELGAWLADRDIKVLFASPLARARETAEIAARRGGLPAPRLGASLVEVHTGCFSDLTIEDIRSRFPAEHAEFEWRSWEGVPDAERVASLASRARHAWGMLREAALDSGGNVACVSHGGFLQWLVRITFGLTDSWMPLLPTGNCGIFELVAIPAGSGRSAYLQWHRLNFQPSLSVPLTPPVF